MGNVPSMGNETSLHSAVKDWCSFPGDRFEAEVDGFVVDIVRDNLLIEVQTRNFSAIKEKLKSLLRQHRVRLIYPIAKEKQIIQVDPATGRQTRRRRSPRRGDVYDLFRELIWMPELVLEANLSIEALMVKEEEVRCADGKGSWRRRGTSIKDRRLIEVVERLVFDKREDYLRLLPRDLAQPFTNRSLAVSMNLGISRTRKMTYCLKKMGAINEIGRDRNQRLYITAESDLRVDNEQGRAVL